MTRDESARQLEQGVVTCGCDRERPFGHLDALPVLAARAECFTHVDQCPAEAPLVVGASLTPSSATLSRAFGRAGRLGTWESGLRLRTLSGCLRLSVQSQA